MEVFILDCGPIFPGVVYKPFTNTERLNNFILDIQRLGFNDFRKIRLLEAVAPYCILFVKGYAIRNPQIDLREFSGPCWIAIVKAINHFDPTAGASFISLLGPWLKAILGAFVYSHGMGGKRYHGAKYGVQIVSIDTPIKEDFTLLDMQGDTTTQEQIEQSVNSFFLGKLIDTAQLSSIELESINNHFFKEFDLDTIAQKHNLSKERIRQIKDKALKKIKAAHDDTKRKHFESP